jgi:hypothetical protein
MNKKILAILSLSFVLLTSCNQETDNKNNTENNIDNNQEQNIIKNNYSTENVEEENNNLETNINKDMTEFNQTDKPQNGDLVAIMKTTNGTMKFRLFPELAPKTVMNFV